jgi:UDP-2,3-diacylglucosamine hydrolase
MERVGLIAGNGAFPVTFARAARQQGFGVTAVAHLGETTEDLGQFVDSITWIRIGELGALIDAFKRGGVQRAVMAGGIRKAALLENFAPDERATRFLSNLTHWGDDVLLRGIAAELESEGIEVVDSTLFLSSLLTPQRTLSKRQPDESQLRDVRFGLAVAKGIGRWDIGQTVVVKSGIVLAVEAVEGTDAALRRGGLLGRGGAVAVKVSKPGQDLRFDVPAVGAATPAVCREAGVGVLALEAGKTLMLERDAFLAAADDAGLVVLGVDADES